MTTEKKPYGYDDFFRDVEEKGLTMDDLLPKIKQRLAEIEAPQSIESAVAPGECGSVPDDDELKSIVAIKLAEQDGVDPFQVIWQGNPPEPYGAVWGEYLGRALEIIAIFKSRMQPPNNQPSSDHVAAPAETSTDTSLASYDWKHWGGGACPVPMGTRVCIRFRDNSVFNNCDSAGIGWDHIGSSNGDIVAYRVESFAAESGISSLVGRPNEKDVVGEGK